MKFEIGDYVWYKGKKCEIADRIQSRKLYALADEKGKEVKGEIDEWWVSEDSLSARDEAKKKRVPIFKNEKTKVNLLRESVGFDVSKEIGVWD